MRRSKLEIAMVASLLLVIRHLLTILKPKTFRVTGPIRVTGPLQELGEEEVFETWQVIDEDTGQWRDVTEREMQLIQGFIGIDLQ